MVQTCVAGSISILDFSPPLPLLYSLIWNINYNYTPATILVSPANVKSLTYGEGPMVVKLNSVFKPDNMGSRLAPGNANEHDLAAKFIFEIKMGGLSYSSALRTHTQISAIFYSDISLYLSMSVISFGIFVNELASVWYANLAIRSVSAN